MPDSDIIAVKITDYLQLLSRYKFRYGSEKELQDGIEKVLLENSVEFDREFELTRKDRIDFLLKNGIGIEVKLNGSANKLANQVRRYCDHYKVQGVIVVATMSRLLSLPPDLNNKPIRTFLVRNF